MQLRIVQRRGDAIETVHPVSAVLCGPDGAVIERVGDPMTTTWRSAAKPFQLQASLSLLPDEVIARLEAEDLAIGAASHSGQPEHVARVQRLASVLGESLALGELRCGGHAPVYAEAAAALAQAGRAIEPIHNNCSGKHIFMIAASHAVGLPGSDYRDPAHPVQRRVRELVDLHSGDSVAGVVIDGCGVPCFVLPLQAMARAWARFAEATDTNDGVLGSIGAAMSRHVWAMSGDERLDLAIAGRSREPLVSKVGAAGLICVAVPHARRGIALKVHSGDAPARAVAIGGAIERWFPGLVPRDAVDRWRVVRNVIGRPIGDRTCEWGAALDR